VAGLNTSSSVEISAHSSSAMDIVHLQFWLHGIVKFVAKFQTGVEPLCESPGRCSAGIIDSFKLAFSLSAGNAMPTVSTWRSSEELCETGTEQAAAGDG
jgi:hypothetical protein